MRALIIISASLATVMEPSSTWATNSFTRFLPRSFALASAPKRSDSTIWSSRPPCFFSTVVVLACFSFNASAIGPSSFWLHLRLQLVEFFRIADSIQKYFLQLVIALQRAAQVGQPRAQVEQFLEWLHLLGHVSRLKVIHFLEFQIHLELGAVGIVAQLVLHRV